MPDRARFLVSHDRATRMGAGAPFFRLFGLSASNVDKTRLHPDRAPGGDRDHRCIDRALLPAVQAARRRAAAPNAPIISSKSALASTTTSLPTMSSRWAHSSGGRAAVPCSIRATGAHTPGCSLTWTSQRSISAANFQLVNHNDNGPRWGLFGNQTVCETKLSVFLCPSCPEPSWIMPGLRYTAVAPGNNYFASVGSTLEFDSTQTGGPPNGLFCFIGATGSVIRPAAVTDGTSNTVAFGEWKIGDDNPATVTPATDVAMLNTFPAGVTRNTPTMWMTNNPTYTSNLMVWLNMCASSLAATAVVEDSNTTGQDWAFGVFGDSMGTIVLPPNSKFPSCLNDTLNGIGSKQNPGIFPLTSFHPGGANVLLADGSVRFLKDSTSMPVIWCLGSRRSG